MVPATIHEQSVMAGVQGTTECTTEGTTEGTKNVVIDVEEAEKEKV
jgi:hypothetical protein